MDQLNEQRFLSQGLPQEMFLPTPSLQSQNTSSTPSTASIQTTSQLQQHQQQRAVNGNGYYVDDSPLVGQQPLHPEQNTPAGWFQPAFPPNCGSSSIEFPQFGVASNTSANNSTTLESNYHDHSHTNTQSPMDSMSPSSPESACFSKNSSASSSISSASDSPDYTYSKKTTKKSDPGKIKKRSRMGCLTCRHRKKRCCETRPRCQECSRLGLKCTWPVPGSEYRNKPKHVRISDGMHYDPLYGSIKILRGIVEYRVDTTT